MRTNTSGKFAGRFSGMTRRMMQLALAVAVASCVPSVYGAGENVQVNSVTSGRAVISREGAITTVRTGTRNTIINYNKLSVGSGETLKFVQPNAASRVLNRIQGTEPTKIDGTLLSNGRVYLVNPAGVMFGNGAVVNASALYASAGHITDANFLNGRNEFTNNTGVVRNDGVIAAGEVHLVGAGVVNFGQIIALGNGGIVTMTAGKDVYVGETVSPTGQTTVMVKVSNDSAAAQQVADGAGAGSLSRGAGDVIGAGIYNAGSIKGRQISLNSGANTNVNRGNLDASNHEGKGGRIEILGEKVGVFAGTVDASGKTGGGTIKVGGDFQGKGDTPRSSATIIAPDARLRADAIENGDGGRVIVWSDGYTRFFGGISARGGALGGDGGFVEVSGKQYLDFAGTVVTLAPMGHIGTLLLDPTTIDVDDQGTPVYGALTDVDQFGDADGGGNHRIDPALINGAGTNVVLQANQDITFTDSVSITTNGIGITVQAGRDIIIANNQSITTRGGAILLSAGDQGATGPVAAGQITMGTNTALTTTGGSQPGANITLRAGDMDIGGGAITAGTGVVAFETNIGTRTIGIGGAAGDLALSTGELNTIATASAIRIGLSGTQSGGITFETVDIHTKTVPLTINSNAGAGFVEFDDDGTGIALAAGNNVTVNAGTGGIVVSQATGADVELTTNTGTSITLNSGGGIGSSTNRLQIGVSTDGSALAGYTGTHTVTAAGDAFLYGVGGMNFTTATITGGNDLNVVAAGDVNATGAITADNVTVVTSGGIGISGAFQIDATAAALQTTATGASGNIRISTSQATLPTLAITTDAGTAQTVRIDATGALAIATNITLQATDSLVVNAATGGTGNLTFSAPVLLTADTIDLQAGDGTGGTEAIVPTNLTVAGVSAAAPAALTFEQDASIADAPAGTGAATALTLISHAGNVSILSSKNLASLSVTGTTLFLDGDVTASGAINFTSALEIQQDVALSGSAITVSGAISSEASQFWTLATTSAGVTTFQSGTTTTAANLLGALDVTAGGGTFVVGSGSAVSLATRENPGVNPLADGHILIDENTTLNGNLTVAVSTTTPLGSLVAGDADVTFGGTIVSQISQARTLTVNTPGVTRLEGSIGSGANLALGGVTTDVQGGSLEGTLLGSGGSFSITVNSPITFNDDVVLLANTTLTAPGGSGNVTFNRTLNSEASAVWTLTVNAAGVTSFFGDVGTGVDGELGALSTDSPGSVELGVGGAFTMLTLENVATNPGANGQINLLGNITLLANVTLTASFSAFAAGVDNITLGQLSGGDTFGITVNSTGVTSFQGGVNSGGSLGLTTITTNAGGSTTFGGGGAISVVTTGAQTYNDAVSLLGDTSFIGGSLAFNGAPVSIAGSTFDLSLRSNTMTFAGGVNSVQGTGDLSIIPLLDTDDIIIGSTGVLPDTLYLSNAGLLTFQDGFASITIGSPTGSHDIEIVSNTASVPVVFRDPVLIQSPTGTLLLTSPGGNAAAIYGDGNASISFDVQSMTFNGSILTNGNAISLNGAIVLGTPTRVDIKSHGVDGTNLFTPGPAGGAITVIGSVNDDGAPTLLVVDAGFGGVLADVDWRAPTGVTTPINGFAVAADEFKLRADIRTNGAGTNLIQFSVNTVVLQGNGGPTTITLDTDATGGATNAGILTATGVSIDHVSGSGAVNLVINTSADGGGSSAAISLGTVGAIFPLNTLSLNAGNANVTVGAVTVSGLFSSAGALFTSNGVITSGGVSIVHTGAVAINDDIVSAANAVNISGDTIVTIVGAPISGSTVILSSVGGTSLSAPVTATLGFLSTGTAAFVLNTTSGITTTNSDIVINHPTGVVVLNGPLSAGTGDVTVTGLGVQTGAGGTIGAQDVTLASGIGDVTIGGVVTATGVFTSTGTAFTNNAAINSHGVSINHTGAVLLNAAVNSAGFVVTINGATITVSPGAPVTGSVVTFGDTAGTVVDDDIIATTAYISSGPTTFTITVNGSITTTNQPVTITYPTGLVTLNGPINAGNAAVAITGLGITSSAAGTIAGSAITLTGGASAINLSGAVTGSGAVSISGTGITTAAGATIAGTTIALNAGSGGVSLGAAVNGSGAFSSSGVAFTNAAAITTAGITINHTGLVTLSGGLVSPGFPVTINGNAIVDNPGAPISGSVVTLAAVTGTLLQSAVTASTSFTATGGGVFTSSATGSITTSNDPVTITHSSAGVSIGGAIAAGTGAVNITGLAVTTGAGGSIVGGAVTLAGGAGNVTLGAAVTGTGAFVSSGVAFSNTANVSANGISINHTGAVSIGNDLISTGFPVTVTGTTITVASGAPVSGSTITFTDTSGVTLNDTVTASTSFTSNGPSTFTISGTGAITTSNDPVTITHATGLVTLNGPINAGTGTVDVSGLGLTSGAGGAITGGTVLLDGNAGAVAIGGVVAASGPLAISGATFVNTVQIAGSSITLDFTGLSSLQGNVVAGGGAGMATINSGGVSQTLGTISAATMRVSGTGGFAFNTTNAVGTLAANVTGNFVFVNAIPLTIGTVGETNGVASNGGGLDVSTPGNLTISQPVNSGGGVLRLTGNNVTDASSAINGGMTFITALAAANLGGAITTSGDLRIEGVSIAVTGAINTTALTVVSTTSASLATTTSTTGGILIFAPTGLTLTGNQVAASDYIANVSVVISGTRAITANGSVGITLGNITGGNLTLTSNGVNSDITIGQVGTSVASRFGNLTVNSVPGTVRLNGDIFAANVAFNDNIGGTIAVPNTATIFSDGSRVIDANGTFVMEQNQKFTVHDSVNGIGDLTIKTNGNTMTLGDLSALGKITLDTNDFNTQIIFLQRLGQRELLSTGALDPEADKGLDVVAGFNGAGAIFMRGTVVVIGGSATNRIQFSSANASVDIATKPGQLGYLAGSNLAVIPVNLTDNITEARMLSGATVLDLIAQGVSGTSPTATQGAVIPRDVQTLSPERGQAISGALRDALRELGIYARDLRTDEVIEYLIGRALYDDVPYKLDPGPTDTTVAANRLPYSPVLPTVDAYRRLFFKEELDSNGKPVIEDGKPKLVAQDGEILRSFGENWQAYKGEKADAATPEGFRAYLEAHEGDAEGKAKQALSYLNQLRDLLTQIRSLGLTSTEFDVSRKVLLSKVRPPNINDEDFVNAVYGPSSRPGAVTASR